MSRKLAQDGMNEHDSCLASMKNRRFNASAHTLKASVFHRRLSRSAHRTPASTSRLSSKRRPGRLSPPTRNHQPADLPSSCFNRRSISPINQSTILSRLSRHHCGPRAFISAMRFAHPQPAVMPSPVYFSMSWCRWVPGPCWASQAFRLACRSSSAFCSGVGGGGGGRFAEQFF